MISFLPNQPRSHYNATPSPKPGIVGVGFHLPPIPSRDFCHYINLFQCRLCRLEFCLIESKTAAHSGRDFSATPTEQQWRTFTAQCC